MELEFYLIGIQYIIKYIIYLLIVILSIIEIGVLSLN